LVRGFGDLILIFIFRSYLLVLQLCLHKCENSILVIPVDLNVQLLPLLWEEGPDDQVLIIVVPQLAVVLFENLK
jgi:hypothetical protein